MVSVKVPGASQCFGLFRGSGERERAMLEYSYETSSMSLLPPGPVRHQERIESYRLPWMNSTRLSSRKNTFYVVMAVARDKGLIVDQVVSQNSRLETFQALADTLLPAQRYASDGLAGYAEVIWHLDNYAILIKFYDLPLGRRDVRPRGIFDRHTKHQ